ncbi:MAG: YlmC/YmxH family sporulation protein [Clostridiales bacterium]|nr:YlmC/YmxH family sporulation protein [Clostridiales bacterium]
MKEKIMDKDVIVLSQLRQMEIVEISEGRRLGFIGDIVFNEDFTKIEELVIPSQNGLLSIFKKKDEIHIKWNQIKTIGIDIILVDRSTKSSNNQAIDMIKQI